MTKVPPDFQVSEKSFFLTGCLKIDPIVFTGILTKKSIGKIYWLEVFDVCQKLNSQFVQILFFYK